MATHKSAFNQWSELNEIESQVNDKNENEESPTGGWTQEQRLIATVKDVHLRSYRIERRQDVLFKLLIQLRSTLLLVFACLFATFSLLLYLVVR